MLPNLIRGVAVRLHSNPITRVAPASGGVSFISSESSKEQKMKKEEDDKQQKDLAKEHRQYGDMMAHAFGEGYSTRSDEEGFGGIYGRNQVSGNPSQDADRLDDFDESQGSEVKEKEKARNQPH